MNYIYKKNFKIFLAIERTRRISSAGFSDLQRVTGTDYLDMVN